MKRILPISTIVLALAICVKPATGASWAATALQELKALGGHWQGTDAHGKPVRSVFQMIAGNTAVMETLYPPDMEAMVTLYSVDGNAIALMHYCPTNNQPHMRATPQPGPVKRLVFEFQGAGNLPNTRVGHEYRLVMEFQDKNHIVEHWTWRENGRDSEMVYHLERKAD